MTSLLPLASYNLALDPFTPTQAIESDLPVTVHITLAAIDPANAIDDEEQPSTLRILKSSAFSKFNDEDIDEDIDDEDLIDAEAEEDDEDEDEDEDDEDEDDDEDDDEDEDEDDEDDEENDDLDSDFDEDDEVEEYVICTLSPKSQFQQTLDLTIAPDEEVYFVVTGSYPIHISGNYVEHPYDGEDSDFDSEEDDEDEEDVDSDEYDLTPDEDELVDGEDFDINDLDDDEDIEAKIEELVEEEEAAAAAAQKASKSSKKESKKRQIEQAQEDEEEEEKKPEPKLTKKQKKAKAAEEKAAAEKKNVEFKKDLEQGPTPSSKKVTTKTLVGGVVIEDRTIGKGPVAKNGSKVGVRYIGKLKNGNVFDKNTSGKPFVFNLGKGEVIKGWDVGVAGMAVGGERRINIPAPYAYGKRGAPGAIPPNADLTFDVKLVSLK